MRIFVTGSTGLIGKEAIKPLLDSEFETFALTIDSNCSDSRVNWVNADIFDYKKIKEIMQQIQPEYLLHFAWTTQGDYLTSDSNYKWLDASYYMLNEFINAGGKRAVFAGTCAEYDFQNRLLNENDKLNPATPYAQCKNELREKAQLICAKNEVSFGWGRIFYVYGHGENPARLMPYVINSLKENKKVAIKSGPLIRDYMYTKDIAAAFVKFLDTKVEGCVNICTAKPVAIKDFVREIAAKMQKEHLVDFIDDCQNQPPYIAGDNSKLLREVCYEIKYAQNEALSEILKD